MRLAAVGPTSSDLKGCEMTSMFLKVRLKIFCHIVSVWKIFLSNLRLGIIAAVSCAVLLADDVYISSWKGDACRSWYGGDSRWDDSGTRCCRCLCRAGDFRNQGWKEEVGMCRRHLLQDLRHNPAPHFCGPLQRPFLKPGLYILTFDITPSWTTRIRILQA